MCVVYVPTVCVTVHMEATGGVCPLSRSASFPWDRVSPEPGACIFFFFFLAARKCHQSSCFRPSFPSVGVTDEESHIWLSTQMLGIWTQGRARGVNRCTCWATSLALISNFNRMDCWPAYVPWWSHFCPTETRILYPNVHVCKVGPEPLRTLWRELVPIRVSASCCFRTLSLQSPGLPHVAFFTTDEWWFEEQLKIVLGKFFLIMVAHRITNKQDKMRAADSFEFSMQQRRLGVPATCEHVFLFNWHAVCSIKLSV